MFRIIYPFVLIIALLVAGCVSSPTNTPINIPAATPTLPVTTDEWTVKMTHSGGIMGLMRSIEVSFDGSYTVTDEHAGKAVSGKLTEEELAKLTELITDAEFIASEKPGGVCSDCFIYDIKIQSSGKNLSTQLNDISLSESGMEDLVISLRELIDSALK
jgi:hypothetical protein